MPVEIRELVIRTSVDQKNQSTNASEETNATSCGEDSAANQESNQLSEMRRMMEEKNER